VRLKRTPVIFTEAVLMKLLSALLLGGLLLLTTGCYSTPAYTGGPPNIKFPEERLTGENTNNIVRNWAFEGKQIGDDLNSIFLLDPVSRLSKWNLR
jgi:hypothetical protein